METLIFILIPRLSIKIRDYQEPGTKIQRNILLFADDDFRWRIVAGLQVFGLFKFMDDKKLLVLK